MFVPPSVWRVALTPRVPPALRHRRRVGRTGSWEAGQRNSADEEARVMAALYLAVTFVAIAHDGSDPITRRRTSRLGVQGGDVRRGTIRRSSDKLSSPSESKS